MSGFSASVEFSGTHDDTVHSSDRVTTVAGSAFTGNASDALDDSSLEAATWSLQLRGEPPTDHFADIDGDGSVEAVELLMAYRDGNGNHAFDWGDSDTRLGFGCVDESPLIGWWIEPSPDLTALISISQMGGQVGWNGLIIDNINGTRVAAAAERESVVLSTNCQLE